MGEIVANIERIGAFTSSEIHRLTGIGTRQMTEAELAAHKLANPTSKAKTIKHPDTVDKKFQTYVDEKKREKRMKRSLDTGASSMETRWGEFMERRAFQLIGLEHSLESKTTHVHPTINHWSGSPDLIADDKVGDIKCYYPRKFSAYYEALETQDINVLKEEYSEEYWQLVSNACILNKPKVEVVLYAPYQNEALEIYNMVMKNEDDMFRYKFIADMIEAEKYYELPFLPDDSGYNNLMTFEFTVPQEDKDFLTERVKLAVSLLNQN